MTSFDYNPETVHVSGAVVVSGTVTMSSGAYLASGLYLASGHRVLALVSGTVTAKTSGQTQYLSSGAWLASGLWLASGMWLASGHCVASGINSVVTIKDNPTTIGNKLRVSITPYGYDVAEGNISGHVTIYKTGFQATVNNVELDLWNVTSSYTYPDAPMQMEVISTDANDDDGDTGARTVKVWYLASGFSEHNETVTMNGLSGVLTTATDIYRVNAFRVATAGASNKAEGDISLRHLSGTPVYSQIATGQTRARNSAYTVPENKTLYITHFTYSVGHASGNRYARFTFKTTYDDKADAVGTIFYPYSEIGLQDGAISIHLDFPLKLPEGTDMKISVISDAASANAICTGSYRGWQE